MTMQIEAMENKLKQWLGHDNFKLEIKHKGEFYVESQLIVNGDQISTFNFNVLSEETYERLWNRIHIELYEGHLDLYHRDKYN